ncbi:LRR receptor-like serine/threonine-protein kinase ERECTA [Dorcoceras hygrometricum]|uniref:LRR receptor-like serine/threonine-protein kinase ERECTA n=1 Tax=Dorcoceras hygrometricum TaxID=472368 RepID=A0A2Z7DHI8_9LAMI|nr:LRR receptor-like serine/threonine-protein kinase ERECTA [Dorcoceras hygrometricum]
MAGTIGTGWNWGWSSRWGSGQRWTEQGERSAENHVSREAATAVGAMGSGTVNSDMGRSTQIRDDQLISGTVNSDLGQSTANSNLEVNGQVRSGPVNSDLEKSTVNSDLENDIPVSSYKLCHNTVRRLPDLVYQISSDLNIVAVTLNNANSSRRFRSRQVHAMIYALF